ncbi:lactate dehydrogenase [Lacticaseibacillus kribbianus]|uniref:lactate dehydrogenase n=1 Tax=Lacticaseibacillus kribbianus TaxID=2926292 RepID=UPI001CD1C8A1|nr:lactate dehydrogenase [Lacticaseibacillus kribbianus]
MQKVVVCGQSTVTVRVCERLIQSPLPLGVALEATDAAALDFERLAALALLGANDFAKATAKSLASADVLIFTDYGDEPAEAVRGENVARMRRVLNAAMAAGFGGVVLVATREAAVGTYFAQRISGLPKADVFGVGTLALSACFERFLATRFAVPLSAVTAYAVGTQQDYVLLWSRAYIGTTPALSLMKDLDAGAIMQDALGACDAFAAATGAAVWAAAVERLLAALAGDALLAPVTTLVDRDDGPLAIAQPMLVDGRGATLLAPVTGDNAEQDELAAIEAKVLAKLSTID